MQSIIQESKLIVQCNHIISGCRTGPGSGCRGGRRGMVKVLKGGPPRSLMVGDVYRDMVYA